MIKLSKSDINTLIAKYLEDEGYKYSKYTFSAESKVETGYIRENLDLVGLVAMGLQYLYGVEHFNNNIVTPCDVLYTICEEHRCETVKKGVHLEIQLLQQDEEEVPPAKKGRPRKPKRKKLEIIEEPSPTETPSDDKEIDKKIKRKLKKQLKEIEMKVSEEVNENLTVETPKKTEEKIEIKEETVLLVGDHKSERVMEFSERPLTECKEAEKIAWNGDYLAVKTVGNELFAFRFGCFMWKLGVVNISVIQWNELGLVTGESDGRVTILNPVNYRRKVFEKHTDVVTKLLLKDKRIFSCSKDGFINSTDDLCSIKVFTDGIKDAVFLKGWIVFCTSFNGNLAIVDVKENVVVHLKSHLKDITCIDQSDRIISTGSKDGFICVYHHTLEKQIFFKAHSASVLFQCWVGNFLISSDKENLIKLWNKEKLLNGEKEDLTPFCIYKYPGNIKKMKSKNDILAFISDDQTISLFDDHMGLISRYSLLGTPKDFDFSENGDSICVLLEDNYPVIINLLKSPKID